MKILKKLHAGSYTIPTHFGAVKVQQLSKVQGAIGGSLVIQGRRYDRTTLLTAIDTFYSSEQNQLLVAQAMEEEALEKDNGGQGEGTEVMAADALKRLEAGDLTFEDNWANAGEKYVSDAVAAASKVATYKYMIERDLGYAQNELTAATQAADAANTLLQQYQSTYDAMVQATAAAQSALDSANSKVTAAQADLTAAQAAQTADQTLQTDCPDLASALATLQSAQQAYQDALSAVTDATGSSCSPSGLSNCNTVADVAAVSSAAEQVSYAEGNVTAIEGSCAYYSSYNAAQSASTMSVSAAEAALSSAQAEQTAADTALQTAQANEQAALAAVNDQQATYNKLLAVEAVKQDIVSKFLLAHKALACSPTASIPDYTDTSLCQYPSDNSKITYALSQAKAAAAEAEKRALLDGLLQDKAFWQQAIDALGGKQPALDQAISWWDAAKAEKQNEGR
ncbi:hypothetical protein GUITHDRAFT_102743 [Guillardia theta CCMP2712]|uniref:Uncharacterized protein n=2 Tax=Guillardia theta TaxID=55529 RepID=L1JTF0_GUITC|nr:hypothetical protein GUITHDRAFT_102743 [Guillardia theta CCMP2712]EKX51475.1 hypothetical protein GUITHDRAFT_102743 [Guillardia theta CCMP2712]|eukprot:XP_005838455.1 hypothetical protein GUITHDRAFT_102743 [Guillardia theta CCMP2712]